MRFTAATVLLLAASMAVAEEPNETFFDATELEPGVLSVSDDLNSLVEFPDTVLGARGLFGDIFASDDQGSPYGDGNASALYDVPTNSGSIDFVISGWPDTGFFGDHGESGGFEAYVTVYDLFGDEVDSFTILDELVAGSTFEYSDSNFEWLNGSYDVEIDNTVGGSADVDFYTFTGLTPGAAFTAETFDPEDFGVDTFLGWFDEFGGLIQDNDDGGDNTLSLLEGTVPDNGRLTFAVTGFPDFDFVGLHSESAPYDLAVEVEGAGLAGDYNADGGVDAADYVVWRNDGLGRSQFEAWAENYGAGSTPRAVPEPAAFASALVAMLVRVARRRSE